MKIYPLTLEDGRVYAFEISNVKITMRSIRKILYSVTGITSVESVTRSDDRLRFTYSQKAMVVHEPWGDNSRYWIGPDSEQDFGLNISAIMNAFANHHSPEKRLWKLLCK